jgi:hypothetical protein
LAVYEFRPRPGLEDAPTSEEDFEFICYGGEDEAKRFGHTNADVTLNVYTQVLDASLRTAVDRIGGDLFTIVHESQTGSELNR